MINFINLYAQGYGEVSKCSLLELYTTRPKTKSSLSHPGSDIIQEIKKGIYVLRVLM